MFFKSSSVRRFFLNGKTSHTNKIVKPNADLTKKASRTRANKKLTEEYVLCPPLVLPRSSPIVAYLHKNNLDSINRNTIKLAPLQKSPSTKHDSTIGSSIRRKK